MNRREVLGGAAAVASLALAGCSSLNLWSSDALPRRSYATSGNWPMARADPQNSGGIATDLDWGALEVREVVSEIDTDRRYPSRLTFADGILVAVVGGRTVLAWDVDAGEAVWRRETERAVTTHPTLANEGVYVPTETRVVALSLESGETRWSVETTSLDLPLLPVGGRLLVEDKPASEVVSLDAATGNRSWTQSVAHSPRGVAVDGTGAYVTQRGNEVGVVTAFGVETGDRRWRRELAPIDVFPTVVGDRVLVGTKAGTVVALSRGDGETLWRSRTTTASEGHFLPLAADDRAAYVAPNNGDDLVALSLADGSELWRTATGQSSESAVLTRESVVVPLRDRLAVYGKADGGEVQSWDLGSDVLSVCPTAAGVFVATGGQHVLRVG